MAAVTPIYGLPYQELADSPNGAQGLQDLATEVEAELVRMDTQPTQQAFTAGGTWNKPAGLKAVRVRVQAGGGGSAGAGTAGSGQASIGAPGGGGEYAEALIPASSLGASVSVGVGAGGGGGAGGGSGSAGGVSSFGTLVTTVGGGGGTAFNAGTFGAAGGGVSGSGGAGSAANIFRVPGKRGDAGRVINGEPFPAPGGDAHLGFGGPIATAQSTTAGTVGQLYGGGGSSSWVRATSAVVGSAGAAGVVIVENLF